MDFPCCLPNQKQSACDQHYIAPGKRLSENREHRCGQADNETDRAQQSQACQQSETDTDLACFRPLSFGQLIGQDGDEHEIVDSEHALHHDQCCQRNPHGRIGGEHQKLVHGSLNV